MDQTTIIKLVQKELEELGLLLKGFDGMEEIPQPIKTLTISKAEHLLDALRKLEYSRKVKDAAEVELGKKETERKSNSTKDVQKEGIKLHTPEPVVKKEEPLVPDEEDASEPEPVVKEKPESGSVIEVQDIKEEPVPVGTDQIKGKKENVSKQILGESIKTGVKVGDVIGAEGRRSIGSKMEVSAIKDLKKAISLADRFRYQKDLFGNNADLMNRTLDKLNGMKTMDDAMACVVSEFDWDDKLESKRDFMSLINRRFQ